MLVIQILGMILKFPAGRYTAHRRYKPDHQAVNIKTNLHSWIIFLNIQEEICKQRKKRKQTLNCAGHALSKLRGPTVVSSPTDSTLADAHPIAHSIIIRINDIWR